MFTRLCVVRTPIDLFLFCIVIFIHDCCCVGIFPTVLVIGESMPNFTWGINVLCYLHPCMSPICLSPALEYWACHTKCYICLYCIRCTSYMLWHQVESDPWPWFEHFNKSRSTSIHDLAPFFRFGSVSGLNQN